MKLNLSRTRFAFTLTEVMLALAMSSVALGAILTSSTSLQKSFNAIDSYFGTHMQQIRIVDYLSRDVKRGLIVTTSADLQTVTISVPNYIIQAGDPADGKRNSHDDCLKHGPAGAANHRR